MYINGAILHSFVYLAILRVRIQLLSPAPYGARRAAPLTGGVAPPRYPLQQPPGSDRTPASDLTSFRPDVIRPSRYRVRLRVRFPPPEARTWETH